jgi:eukaryotic-like serine/threonine-protein kinase
MMKHAQEPPPPLSAFRPDLPAGIEPLILQALAKNPQMRHQTAAELIDDLNRVSRSFTNLETSAAATVPTSNNNIWKTAFVVLAGISLLSVAMIWATSVKQTNPPTLQADSNSQPVQPINPATGLSEQGLATIVPMSPESMSNSNAMTVPNTLGSDGNPYWQNGKVPPGAPQYVPPGNYIDPNNPNSPFNPDDTNTTYYRDANGATFIVVPTTPGSNSNIKPSTTKTPKNGANTSVQPSPLPNETPKPQTSPTPEVKSTPKTTQPTPKTTPQPKNSPSSTKPKTSGKTQDSD